MPRSLILITIIQSHSQNICGYLIIINITYNFEYFNHSPPPPPRRVYMPELVDPISAIFLDN